MPCRCGGYSKGESPEEKLEIATRLVCHLMHWMPKGPKALALEASAELREFWSRHQEADRQREESEKKRNAENLLRDRAKKKLSGEELAALRREWKR
jgi:hypothetical protein